HLWRYHLAPAATGLGIGPTVAARARGSAPRARRLAPLRVSGLTAPAPLGCFQIDETLRGSARLGVEVAKDVVGVGDRLHRGVVVTVPDTPEGIGRVVVV